MTAKDLFVAAGAAVVGALVVIIYFILTAQTPAKPTTGPCSGGNPHCIIVSVINVGGMPKIQWIADENFKGNGAPIFWDLQNLTGNANVSYTFPAHGIDFYPATTTKTDPPAPPGEFTNCGTTGSGGTSFKCDDKNQSAGKWPYTVTVQGSDSTTLTQDPYIINN